MSIVIIDCPAALVASPRPRLSLLGERRYANDAQPRLLSGPTTHAVMAWRLDTDVTMRGFVPATQDGRHAFAGAALVTTTTAAAVFTAKQHSIRSGPPTSSP
jgi:hypothetical protein